MADEKHSRRGKRPGRGSPRNEERIRRAKRRAAREAAIVGSLSERVNRDCVFRNRERVRAEVLVYVLRQLLPDPDFDRTLYEACSTALMGRVAPTAQRPRAARMVNAMVRKAIRRSGLPDDDREFRAFLTDARGLIWAGIASPKAGDVLWQERFGFRLHDRLKNVVTKRLRDRERPIDDTIELHAAPEREADPDLKVRLSAAIDGLPEALRFSFVLYHVEGYTHGEIGEMMGVAEGTSKARVFEARARLREVLADFA